MSDEHLRATFDGVARGYAGVRPSYPSVLVTDVLEFADVAPGRRVLEVGCGTGQASRLFAERGYPMLLIDVGANMIEVAREELMQFPDVEFRCCAFEDCRLEETFPLLISATAFHWIDPERRFALAYEALVDGGTLAVFSNRHVNRVGFFEEVQEVYSSVAPELVRKRVSENERGRARTLPGENLFSDDETRVYPWEARYSATDYLRLLGSYSDHIALPDATRNALFEGVRELIERRYGGEVEKSYAATLSLRRNL